MVSGDVLTEFPGKSVRSSAYQNNSALLSSFLLFPETVPCMVNRDVLTEFPGKLVRSSAWKNSSYVNAL